MAEQAINLLVTLITLFGLLSSEILMLLAAVSETCFIENGEVTSDPFHVCSGSMSLFVFSDVEKATGYILNNTVSEVQENIWWVNLTVQLTSSTRLHVITTTSKQEATQASNAFPLYSLKWFNIANGMCDPNVGSKFPPTVYLAIILFFFQGVCMIWKSIKFVSLSSYSSICKELCARWDVLSVLCLFFFFGFMLSGSSMYMTPKCDSREESCIRRGTYSLPMMTAESTGTSCDQNHTKCYLMWRIQDGPKQIHLITLNGTCQEAIPPQGVTENENRMVNYVLVNPSTKTDCNRVQDAWISNKRFWSFLGAGIVILFITVLLLVLYGKYKEEVDRMWNRCLDHLRCHSFTRMASQQQFIELHNINEWDVNLQD